MATDWGSEQDKRTLMLGFAGFMVMLSGAVTIVQGLWALDHKNNVATRATASQLSYGNLETWGWIMLIWGVIAFAASFAIFAGKQWGRWVGIVVATISILLSFFWVFAFPIAAFGIIIIDVIVIWTLFSYGRPVSSAS
jgi:hypothetical protein